MIRKLSNADFQNILEVIDDAAIAYKGKIPSLIAGKSHTCPKKNSKKKLRQEYNSTVG
jgi:hypothetical protein